MSGFLWAFVAILLVPAMSASAAVLLLVAATAGWNSWRARRRRR